jgi:protoporphyrinogen IX oxidase
MLLARIVHVIGNILWLGGGAVAALFMAQLASASQETRTAAARAVRKLILAVVTPGMLLSFAGGLYMLFTHWSAVYARAPWMHTKLLVGLVAAAFSGVLSGKLRRAADGAELPAGSMRTAGWVLVLSAIAGVFLVFTRFGSR